MLYPLSYGAETRLTRLMSHAGGFYHDRGNPGNPLAGSGWPGAPRNLTPWTSQQRAPNTSAACATECAGLLLGTRGDQNPAHHFAKLPRKPAELPMPRHER